MAEAKASVDRSLLTTALRFAQDKQKPKENGRRKIRAMTDDR